MLAERAKILRLFRRLGLLGLILLGLARVTPAAAESGASEWFTTDHGRVRLIAGGLAADAELVFDSELDSKWQRALAKLGVDLSMLSAAAGHA